MWSDPHDRAGWAFNGRRMMGAFYGKDVLKQFLDYHGLRMLIRSHDCVPEGYEEKWDGLMVTLFSASNYYQDGSNCGAFMKISNDGTYEYVQYMNMSDRVKKMP